MNRRQNRMLRSRPWWTLTGYDDVRGHEVVNLVGYALRLSRQERRKRLRGGRAGNGIAGYPRFGR